MIARAAVSMPTEPEKAAQAEPAANAREVVPVQPAATGTSRGRAARSMAPGGFPGGPKPGPVGDRNRAQVGSGPAPEGCPGGPGRGCQRIVM